MKRGMIMERLERWLDLLEKLNKKNEMVVVKDLDKIQVKNHG